MFVLLSVFDAVSRSGRKSASTLEDDVTQASDTDVSELEIVREDDPNLPPIDDYANLPFFSPPPHILRGMNQSTLGTRRALFGNSTRPPTSPTTTARHSQPASPSPETCIDEESYEFDLSNRVSPVHTSAREAASLFSPADPSAQGTIGPGWVYEPARTASEVKRAPYYSSYDDLNSTQLSTSEDSDARWTRSPTVATARDRSVSPIRTARSGYGSARHSQPPSPSPETCIDEESSEFDLSNRVSPVHTSAREAVSDRNVCGFMYTPESAHFCAPADPSAQGTFGPGYEPAPRQPTTPRSAVKTARSSSSYDSLNTTQLSTSEYSDSRWTRSHTVATARDLSVSPIRTARSGYDHNTTPDSMLCEKKQSQFAYQKTPNGYTQRPTHSTDLQSTPSAPLYDMRTPRTARASVSRASSLLRSPTLSSDVATAVDGVSNSDNNNEVVTASPRLTTARHWAAAAADKSVAAYGKPQVIVRANQGDGKVQVEVSLSFKLNTTGTIRVRGEMPPGLHPRAVSVNGQQIWFDPSRQ